MNKTLIAVAIMFGMATPAQPKETTWNRCTFTVYHKKFESRQMACGKRFSHRYHYVASRSGRFYTHIEFAYRSKNGKLHVSRGIIGDRGGLPLTRRGCVQYDLPHSIAKELGLYRVVHGRTIRTGMWRVVK